MNLNTANVDNKMSRKKKTNAEDENQDRGNWSGKLDFFLSCLGYAVGLGNLWRFPYLCYRNGGGAFLVPYCIMLVFVGLPLLFLELSLAQYTSSGISTCWNFAPVVRGIGISMFMATVMSLPYYAMIIAYSLYYLVASFSEALPWRNCNNWWNTNNCSELLGHSNCTDISQVNETTFLNYTCDREGNFTESMDTYNTTSGGNISPSEEYYNNRILRLSQGIEHEWAGPYWDITLCLLAVFIILFLCLIKGIKSSGKVVYFTALFPYIILAILLVKGLTLPGSMNGLYFYVVPKFTRLIDSRVWVDAASQVFFGLSIGSGGMITLGSYNRFHHNTLRDSIIVALCNSFTSIFAGFVVFSFLGYMAEVQNMTIEKVVSSGPGLAFIVYPSAVTLMPLSQLWSILFFLMLITLGLDTIFCSLEIIITALIDLWPHTLRSKRSLVLSTTCLCLFLLGLPLCTNAGVYIVQLLDVYLGGWPGILLGFSECISISMLYGCDRFFNDIQNMIGIRPSVWWKICWKFMTPLLVGGIFIFTWIDYSPAKFGDDYSYPVWADILGWLTLLICLLPIPAYAVFYLVQQRGPLLERIRRSVKPNIFWGPALEKHRRLLSTNDTSRQNDTTDADISV